MPELYKPVCVKCAERGIETLATVQRWGEDLCASCFDRENERAHEASLEAHYGGSGVTTQAEAMTRAYDAMEARRR